MATVTFNTAGNTTLNGTSNDDQITIASQDANGSDTIVGGAGNDTIVFDNVLAAAASNTAWGATATGFATSDDAIVASLVETFVFDNGTVSANAPASDELLMVSSLEGSQWDVENLLTYDGSSVVSNGGWDVSSVDGSTLTAGNSIVLMNGSTVVGVATLSANGQTLNFAPNTAFQATLDIGETASVSFELVLTDGTDTFTETLTAVVTGTASDANNTFVAQDSTAANEDLMGGDDRATGALLGDTIFGGDGNDTVFAGADDAGADLFIGGDGNDILAGGANNDILVGDAHDGVLDFGDATSDEGANTLFGGDGNDVIAIGGYTNAANLNGTTGQVIANATGTVGGQAFGGAGNDTILGTASGNDLVGMGEGADTVNLGDGNNTVYAGADDTMGDSVNAGNGDNEIFTGAGNDTVAVGNGDNVIGLGDGADVVATVGSGDNEIFGGAGADNITDGTGDDTIYGGADGDTILLSNNGNNVVFGGEGTDGITGGTGNDVIEGGEGVDTITVAAGGNNTVTGGEGDDVLTAGGGNDTFVFASGDGNDNITGFGAGGTDKLDVTSFGLSGIDALITSVNAGNTTIYLDEDTTIILTGVTSVDADDFLF